LLKKPWEAQRKERRRAKPKQSARAKKLEHGVKVVLKGMQSP
jgi:hypothetical protein